jgi:hypothetical protein
MLAENVKQAWDNAIFLMRRSGFEVGNTVEVAVDLQLPFMGYTIPQHGGFSTVVSGMAVESGMLGGLLVHEMSHVCRMQTNHPSHNQRIIEEAVNGLGQRALSRDYQRKIIRELVNNIQDLYADHIAMKVFRKGRFVSREQLTSFLQDWVKDEPVKSNDQRKDRWVNVGIMVNNARALGQMRRHRIADTNGKAKASNKRFLSRMPPTVSNQFPHFINLMANLKENITEDDYRKLLTDYLNEFIEIAENS